MFSFTEQTSAVALSGEDNHGVLAPVHFTVQPPDPLRGSLATCHFHIVCNTIFRLNPA
jgi:hypothetical protein